MPRKAKELSALEVRRLSRPGDHEVGGIAGLQLQVTASGARSWIYRTTIAGRRRHLGLGGFPDVTLAQARERAREFNDAVFAGTDPVQERLNSREALRRDASGFTFGEAAKKWHALKLPEYRNEKHAAQVLSTLVEYAFPIIGKRRIRDVDLSDVLKVLEPHWLAKTETTSRLRSRIERVLSWATVSGHRTGDNPARWRGNLDSILPKPSKIATVVHHKAIAVNDIPNVFARVGEVDGMGARALEFLIITATRSGEVRGATWDEIDFKNCLWVIPGTRMKTGREHRVPLSETAIEILGSLPKMAEVSHVFASGRGAVLSDMTLSAVFKRLRVDATPHGCRSTFRDWCSERTNYPHEVAEMALAHTIKNKAEAAYRRGDLLVKRERMMRDWALYVAGTARQQPS